MADLTINDLKNILIGTELSGDLNNAYKVSLAVGKDLLGIRRGNNSSGFSFGVVQLDIGNNSFAQNAYNDILSDALKAGSISQSQFNHLSLYNGVQRPDLNPAFSSTYRNDKSFLTRSVFSLDGTKSIIDDYTNSYISQSLQGSVNGFLDAVESRWGSDTVFNPTHPDYSTAVSAMVSISNRTGGLGGSTRHFVNNKPTSLSDVRARYDHVLGDHWSLVEKRASLFAPRCFPSGTLITLADGRKKAIERITTSDKVLTFDNDGKACVGEVVHTYTNTTPEFIRLVFEDGRDDLVATPGHAFLTETGDYLELGTMARLGGWFVRLVDISGEIVTAKAERLVYSAEVAHLFVSSQTRSMAVAGNLAFKEDVTEGWSTHNFEVRTTHNYVAGDIRVHNQSGPVGQLGDSLDSGLDRLSGVRDGDGSFLDKASDLINAGMHVVARAMKNVSAGTLHVGLVLLLFFKLQIAYAQVERAMSPVIEPTERYELECMPKSYSYAEIFYSASRSDLYEVDEHLGNTSFIVMSFVNTENEGQYLKGYFFNANKTRNPTGLPIPKDRVDEYRRDDGFREIWFVLSSQWLCAFSFGSQEWLNNMWEER